MAFIKRNINRDNVIQLCRICLENKTNLVSLLSHIVIENEHITDDSVVNILIKLTTEFFIEDRLPSLICMECIDLLKAAYVFKQKYEKSNEILKNYLANSKIEEIVEPAEENDNDCADDCNYESDHEGQVNCKKLLTNETNFESEHEEQNNSDKNCKTIPKKQDIFVPDVIPKRNKNSVKEEKSLLHSCPICTVEFTSLQLRKHIRVHKALKKYLNGVSMLLPNTKFFATPRNTVSLLNKEPRLHKCPFCHDEFPVEKFRLHVNVHKMQSEFKCNKCDRVFRKVNHLSVHRIQHMKECPYKCKQCGKGFVIKKNYDCHILTHANTELPHKCSFCLKRFSNPEHLNRHIIIHTENISYATKYKVCKCYHCKKSFRDKDDLKAHICVPIERTSNKKYVCKTCSKTFGYASSLYNHNRHVHKLRGVKTLCSVCGSYVANIYSHMVRHTGQRPFSCNQCVKTFTSRPLLKQHLLVHSGQKPFVCSVCAKAFNNLYNLQVHERIHKGDRCHICPVCNKGFLEKSYLKKHMNVHKNIN